MQFLINKIYNMKLKIVLILLSYNLIVACTTIVKENANSNSNATKEGMLTIVQNDSISCNDIHLNGLEWGASASDVIKNLGQPDSVTTFIDDEYSPEYEYKVFHYGSNEIYFDKKTSVGFVLYAPKFDFNGISIGDNVEKLKMLFPNSFKIELVDKNKLVQI